MKRKPPLVPFTQTGTILLIWAAFLFLILFLTACSAETAMYPVSAAAEQADADLTFLVDPEWTEDSASADDGTLLASCSYQLPLMTVLRRDGTAVTEEDVSGSVERSALTAATTFNGEFRRWAAEADFPALAEAAREDYAWRTGEGSPWVGNYDQSLGCTVYQTDRLVSVTGVFYYYGGGAHPNRVYLGWNFDTQTGAFLTPEQIFSDTAAVTEELIRQAEQRAREADTAPEELFWPDFRDLLSNWTTAAVTFDGEGMTVAWSPYDLAAYAVGEQLFTIPLSWLRPHLNSYGQELLGLGS